MRRDGRDDPAASAALGGTTGATGAGAGPVNSSGPMGSGGMSAQQTPSNAAGVTASEAGMAGTAVTTCPVPALKSGDMTKTIAVGSSMRTYVLHVPAKYDGTKPSPLIVDFHALGGSGPQELQGSPYVQQADTEGVVMAFPSGLSGPSGGAWNVGPCCVASADDVGFARALVADVETAACIDAKRVYAVGFSMGGGMSHYIACHAADVFAAVAPAAFDLLQENVGDCRPPRPITVVSFRGSSDPIVPFAGGASSVVAGMPVTFLGAQKTFETWAQLNGCKGSASSADTNNCQSYSSCDAGVEVVLCTKQNGGHEPGNATIGWPILKRHVLP
jgi:polyhydroxybutyrate depolymerase